MSVRPLWPFWPFVALLVVWNNALQPLLGPTARLPGGSWSFVMSGIALIAISLATACASGLRAADLGFDLGRVPRGAVIGALVGLIAIVCVGAVKLAPILVGHPIAYEPVEGVSVDELAWHLAFFLPVGAVVPEEIAFRGTLLGTLAMRYGTRAAVLASAAVFAVWHVTVVAATIGATTIAPPSPWATPATLGALALVFVGGLLLAGLRLWTGTLASTIVAHWMFNAVVLVGFRAVA